MNTSFRMGSSANIGNDCNYSFIGKLNTNVAPLPSGLFSAHILPPWASIIPLHMNNPKPVPPVCDLVANCEKPWHYLRIYSCTSVFYTDKN